MRTASNLTALEHIGSARNAFADLEHWLYSHTSTTHKLHSIEVEQERRGREVLRLMLQAHIDSRGDGCVGDGLVVNPQGSSEEIVYRHKRLRSRRLITVFGPVSIRRMEYSSRDRKSTRLNSSHGYISYAVFCLKKKMRSTVTVSAQTLRWYYGLVIDPYSLTIRRAGGQMIVAQVHVDAWNLTIDLYVQFHTTLV